MRGIVSETKRLEKFVCSLCSRMEIRRASDDEISLMKEKGMLYIEEDACTICESYQLRCKLNPYVAW